MPNINIQTKINKPADKVFSKFNDGLFENLIPPVAIIQRNDGIFKGAIVKVGFKVPFIKTWQLEIIDVNQDEWSYYFIDKGISGMPFRIKEWQHTHRVIKVDESNSIISDEISFTSNNKVLDSLVWVIFTIDMKLRSKKYKKFFKLF